METVSGGRQQSRGAVHPRAFTLISTRLHRMRIERIPRMSSAPPQHAPSTATERAQWRRRRDAIAIARDAMSTTDFEIVITGRQCFAELHR